MIDVGIVGAGPNGLMLACELALNGIQPIVLERLSGPSVEQRANGMVDQVVRMLDRRGLYERLTGDLMPPTPQPGFVFGAFPLDLRDLPDNHLYTLLIPQREIERMLDARARELGVEIRTGHDVIGLVQDTESVVLSLRGGETVTARYVIGADGSRSTVRKLAGIDFPGVTTDHSVSRTAHVSVPSEQVDPATGGLIVDGYGTVPPFQHTRTESGLVVWAQAPDKPAMIATIEWPREMDSDAPASLDDLRASLTRVLGVEVPIGPPQGDGPHLLRRLTGQNRRIADRYRDDRVFLLGDAAHVHSAIGGPGLNLGLQDAVNLGWKLAGVLDGWAPEALLDSYEAERRPVAEPVTMSTRASTSARPGPGPLSAALTRWFGSAERGSGERGSGELGR